MADHVAALRAGRISAPLAGLADPAPRAYLLAMGFFGRFSPARAYRDLRFFLAQRRPYELGFLVAAMAITGFFVFAFAHDSRVEPVYRRDIVYVQQWPANRTDAEIRAQQKIDAPLKAKRLADEKRELEEKRAEFQRLDNAMSQWGL